MCGVAGLVRWKGEDAGRLDRHARAMGDSLFHRGPDDGGVWTDAETGVGLAHRRLSILDLSPAGHQPMASSCGRFVIVYNGEVFNHGELRAELAALGRPFRGHSDTEVIIEGCAAWGIEATVSRLIGMFAFALWDRAERRLTLVRDRLGIKPLYWSHAGGVTLFGSELKAFHAVPDWQPVLDRGAAAAFMRHAYVPAPATIYQGVHKLMPGCLLTLAPGAEPVVTRYWDAFAVAEAGIRSRQDLSDAEATDQLEALLTDAVGRRMVADVPLGAFLSGGVDSSTVVALMQKQSARPVRTFSIGFTEPSYDEAPHAKAVAAHLGTDHTELYVDPAQALELIPRLPEIYDEPFADSSQLPTTLVSALTRKHVTVALSGDGGDELFAGYNRYVWATGLWRRLGGLPLPLRRAAAAVLTAVPPGGWDAMAGLVPSRRVPALVGDKLHKLAGLLTASGQDDLYRRLVSFWTEPGMIVAGGREPKGPLWDPAIAARFPDFTERMQVLDLVTYLPDDILTKVDRASMAVALEARVPLLDHRVVEHSWRLPPAMKVRGGTSKWLLRQVLYRHVPKALIERPKMGFGVPIGAWMRGPLRPWAEELLSERALKSGGLLEPAPIRALWAQHLGGRRNWQYHLWNALMLQAWLGAGR